MSSPRDASTTNFLRALNQLGDTLLNSPDNIPWQVVAETLGSASRACRSYIFLLKNSYENKRTLTMVAEWCSEGVQPQIGAPDMDHFVLADHGFRRLEKVLSHGGWINDRVRDCPPSERAVFAAQDIQSILLLPIMVREEWIGLVGLDNTQDDSRWSESEVEFLRAGARMMASSYDRWREEKAARWRERNVMALRDAAQALLRETDEVPWQRFVDILGPAARSDRVYVFLNQEDLEAGLTMSQVAEWCARGITAQSGNPDLQNFPYADGFLRWHTSLAGGGIIGGPVRSFPESERTVLEPQGVKSLLIVPLLAGQDFIGFIGFDNCHDERPFDLAEKVLLRSAADNLAHAIERYRISKLLRNREERFRQLVEFNPMPTLVTDSAKEILTVNRAFEEAFGYGLSDLSDLPSWWRLSGATVAEGEAMAEACVKRIAEARANGHLVTPVAEVPLRTKDDRVLTMACRLAFAGDRNIVVFHDLTDRLRAEEALREKAVAEQANRAKTEFLAMMNHELRTPLNSIIGPSEILELQVDQAELKSLVDVIHTSGQHLLGVINDILDLVRIESGHLSIALEAVDPWIFFEDALRPLREKAQNKGLDWQLDVDALLPPTLVLEPRLVHRLLYNLVGNAIKFTPEGSISVTLEGDDGQGVWSFSVRDTGPGIAFADQERIFESFQQGDMSMNREHEGTGLGLAICRQICARLDGKLTLETALGEGACFTVRLPYQPLPQGEAERPAFTERAEDAEAFRTYPPLLVVEDDARNRLSLAAQLNHFGVQADFAASGEEAVACWAEKRQPVILMDIRLPGIDGREAARQIRALASDASPYIIAQTAFAMNGQRETLLSSGMDSFVSKPLNRSRLARSLREARAALEHPAKR